MTREELAEIRKRIEPYSLSKVALADVVALCDALEAALTEVERLKHGKCQHCNMAPARDEHTCPFRVDIHNDDETLCDCCEDCAHECAMDI